MECFESYKQSPRRTDWVEALQCVELDKRLALKRIRRSSGEPGFQDT